jgi:hypothetical protein
MLSVAIDLFILMLNVIMLSVLMLSVIVLNVVFPLACLPVCEECVLLLDAILQLG